MKLATKQKGLSSIGWLFVGITIFFYFTIAAKIVPIYLDDLSVKEAMKKLGETAGANAFEISDVIGVLETQFDINNVRDINLRQEGLITINRDNDPAVAEMNYEKVAPIFKNNGILQNMDIVIRFKHTAVLK